MYSWDIESKWYTLRPEKCPSLVHFEVPADNWEYQGFFEFNEAHGFSKQKYNDHYNEEDESKRINSVYWKTMNKLIKSIEKSKVLDNLIRTDNFCMFVSDHEY